LGDQSDCSPQSEALRYDARRRFEVMTVLLEQEQ
jgi:hypothetical protein